MSRNSKSRRVAKKRVNNFLVGKSKNGWISCGRLKVYLRKTDHCFSNSGVCLACLDIANVIVVTEEQNQGVFRRWLNDVLKMAPAHGLDAVMIENVLTERFANFFRRSGWYEVKNYSHPNFYKFMYPEGRP
ncbi:MAG: hypothetical protein M0Z85_09465 [Gammaproteobacteria bacterium]|nr:hypothetical protein [Gammaproteobacteria bacterium]